MRARALLTLIRLQHCTLEQAKATDAEIFRLLAIERLGTPEQPEGGDYE